MGPDDAFDRLTSTKGLSAMAEDMRVNGERLWNSLAEMARVVKPDGRLQIGDILVQKVVPQAAKERIDLWTG